MPAVVDVCARNFPLGVSWSLRDSSRPSFPFGLFTPAFVTLSESLRRGVTGCHSQGVRTTRARRTIFHLSIHHVFPLSFPIFLLTFSICYVDWSRTDYFYEGGKRTDHKSFRVSHIIRVVAKHNQMIHRLKIKQMKYQAKPQRTHSYPDSYVPPFFPRIRPCLFPPSRDCYANNSSNLQNRSLNRAENPNKVSPRRVFLVRFPPSFFFSFFFRTCDFLFLAVSAHRQSVPTCVR